MTAVYACFAAVVAILLLAGTAILAALKKLDKIQLEKIKSKK